MTRRAFVMQVNPGQQEEYRRRHNPIWPELEQVLKEHGVAADPEIVGADQISGRLYKKRKFSR